MNFKSLTFPRGKTPGLFPAMLNEQAALGWEYVELYACNPNRPQHLSVLFKSDAEPEVVAEPEPVAPQAPEAPAEPEAPKVEEAPVAKAPAKAPAKSAPGARRGRKPAVKKA